MVSTEERHIAVVKVAAKKAVATRSEGAARLPRRQGPVAEWNEDITRTSLIQIIVID